MTSSVSAAGGAAVDSEWSWRRALPRALVVAFGVAVFAAHASAYRDWMVDDSGISIAYARNLAAGHGLVSQPGMPPVEGYSNTLWVLLLAALDRLGTLPLPAGPKALALLCVTGSYTVLTALVERVAPRAHLTSAIALFATSANPAFVIWCVSGLENSLYALTISLLAYFTLRWLESPTSARLPIVCGAMAALVGATRPDGVLFAVAPVATAACLGRRDRTALLRYALAFGAPFGALLASRMLLFHHLVPNTAIAKGGPRALDVLQLVFAMSGAVDKLEALLERTFTPLLSNAAFLASLWMVRFVIRRGRMTDTLATLLAFAAGALADYMIMPEDWMREARFGTAFFPLYYAALFSLVDLAIDATAVRMKSAALAAVTAAALSASMPDYCGRALAFTLVPNIDLFFVKRGYAERFDRIAESLGVPGASILLPDVGGMLLWSKLRVYDLAGLCDADIARLRATDPIAERDFILTTMRPTLLHTDGPWSRTLAFERAPQFSADYVPVFLYGANEDEHAEGHASGLFVRREAVRTPEAKAALLALGSEPHAREAFVPRPPPSAVRSWLAGAAFIPEGYRTPAPPTRASCASSPDRRL